MLVYGYGDTKVRTRLIEKANPCFRERHVESSRPGELLAQDRTKFYNSLEALQSDLDAYLEYYNNERPHQGYRVTAADAQLDKAQLPRLPEPGGVRKKIAHQADIVETIFTAFIRRQSKVHKVVPVASATARYAAS